MPLKELYETSPFGMVSALFYGTIQSALFTLLAVYAASMNFTIFQISLVTFLLAISGAISQYPIGKLSDKYDRRKVIVISTFGASFLLYLLYYHQVKCTCLVNLLQAKYGFLFF